MKISIGLNVSELPSLCKFLNRNFYYDRFAVNDLKQKIFDDPLFNNSYIFSIKERENRFIGFIHGVKGEYKGKKTGWIKIFAVDKKYKNQKMGTKLLKMLEEKFTDVDEIRVMDSVPSYYQPGLDPRYTDTIVLLLKNGYQRCGENIHLETDLSKIDFGVINKIEKLLNSQGILIKRATNKIKNDLLQWIDENFKLWHYETELAFNYKPIRAFVAIHNETNKIVGFSCYEVTSQGWFGPIGTHPEYRKLGIGRLLLLKCLKEQKKFGRKIIVIPWVPVNTLSFYLHGCNAKISRVFWTFRKTLS